MYTQPLVYALVAFMKKVGVNKERRNVLRFLSRCVRYKTNDVSTTSSYCTSNLAFICLIKRRKSKMILPSEITR